MTDASADEDRLFEEAMDLIIRLQNDSDNLISRRMVQEWRARSSMHEKVWSDVAEIHGLAGKVLTDQRTAEGHAKLGLTRRNLMIGMGLGIGMYATGKFVLPDVLLAARADHLTRTAEIRRVALDDGSIATLGPDSAIALAYSNSERGVELLAGMCFFEVAQEARRPFRLKIDEVVATASGTTFDVSNDDSALTLSVSLGSVDIQLPATSRSSIERIDRGQCLTLRGDEAERGLRDPGQIASWRDGLIVADRETVSSVIARIARWQPGRTLIIDPTMGSRNVSGVYDVTRPISALEAVVHPFGGKVRQFSSHLTVISPL